MAPDTKANALVSIQMVTSPKGHDYVMVSPWDGYVRAPPFDNDSSNFVPVDFVPVDIVEKGDTAALLQNGKANQERLIPKPQFK